MLPEQGQIGHDSSVDLVQWVAHPVAITRGNPGEPDSRNVATGCVVEHCGWFYLFYTGNQNICLATSGDLMTWTKHSRNPLVIPDGRMYGLENFRDPFVFRFPHDGRWWMIWGAQEAGRWGQRAGCVGLAKSDDLLHWTLHPPLWAPRIGPHCDCPQLIRQDGRWYLFYLQRNTRYRVASQPTGPFLSPPTRDLYTPKANAGSRPVFFGGRWITFPFVTRLQSEDDLATWRFGGPLAMPRELVFTPDGTVGDRLMAEHRRALEALPATSASPLHSHHVIAGDWHIDRQQSAAFCTSLAGGTLLLPDVPGNVYFDATVTIDDASGALHLLLRVAIPTALHEGYQLSLRPDVARLELRAISTYDIDPVIESRDSRIPAGRPFRLTVLLSGSVLECFVDEHTSLTSRIHRYSNGGLALEARDTAATFERILIRHLPVPTSTVPSTNPTSPPRSSPCTGH